MAEINIQRMTPNINIDTATRNYHLPIASATTLGGIKVGTNLTIETDGTLNAESTEYDLPVATASTLGGIKVGDGLTISDGSLSPVVDANLDVASTNPVRNSVVTSNINTLASGLQTTNSNVSTLSNTVSSLGSTVSGHTTSISNLSSDLTTLSGTVSDHTTDIGNLQGALDSVDGTLDSIGDDIDTINDTLDGLSALSSTVDDLADSSLTDISRTELLPAATWTSGDIFVLKRGKVGIIYFDLEGSLTLGSGASSVIYTFTDVTPAVKSSAALISDAGVILGELDDYSQQLSVANMSGSSVTITKLKGSIPIAFV